MMDPKLQRRVQRYGWDKAAGVYEQFWQAQLQPAQDRLIALAGFDRGERVLDVACGTGLVTMRAAALVGPSGSVVATDISEAMVTKLAATAEERGLTNITTARMDAETLDFPDRSFDVVLCALGLMYLPNPIAALVEMRRVLKSGGRAVVAVWGARDKCGWAEIFPIVDARVESEVCPMFFQLGTGSQLEDSMRVAGYTRIHAERISSVLHYHSAEEACGAAFAGGPVALAYSRFDAEDREAAHAEYLASIDRWRSDDRYHIPGEFVVARGATESLLGV